VRSERGHVSDRILSFTPEWSEPVMRVAIINVFLIASAGACARATTARTDVDVLDTRRAELIAAVSAAGGRMGAGEFVTPFSTLFAPLGVYVSSAPLSERGPASARAWLERDTLNAKSTARWTALRADVSADGRDGYTYGYFDVIRPSGDTLPGRYHAYWRRGDSGTWQILAFSRGRRAPGAITQALPTWLPAPTARTPVTGRDSATMLREVMDTERAFADSVGTSLSAAFASYAAPDGAKLEGGPSYAFGREEIGKLFAGAPPGAGPQWTPEIGTVASSGDLAFTTGPVTARRPGDGPGPPPGAKYFTIWRRMPNGEWRYVVD
jgi:ketosteroid isomerase-like protein